MPSILIAFATMGSALVPAQETEGSQKVVARETRHLTTL
jgi:hypothetical protein